MKKQTGLISDFHRGINEICALPGYYNMLIGS
jgi:hypothetical protein